MSPFTLLLGRLVELLGTQISTELVREFAGKTVQFPITNDYGFNAQATLVGAGYAHWPTSHTAPPLQTEPHRLLASATAADVAQLQNLDHQLTHSLQALQQHAKQLEQARLTVREVIVSLGVDRVRP